MSKSKLAGSSKVKTSVALDPSLLEWIDKMVASKRFANRTHAVEFALQKLKDEYKND